MMDEAESPTLNSIIEEILNDIEQHVDDKKQEKSFRSVLDMDTSSDSSSSSSDSTSSDSDGTATEDNLVTSIRQRMKKLHKKRSEKSTVKSEEVNSDDDLDENSDGEGKAKGALNQKYLKTKGELTLDDLEPVTRQGIQLDNTVNLVKMGEVVSIVDEKLVIIQSILNENGHSCKPLNEESILFDSNRRELGKVFEVFGPVHAPFYSIRFNNVKEITENSLSVERGASIFYAHDSTEYTKFIFNLDELRRLKGSDASWNNDNEPPAECVDYSDDEQERNAKKELKQKRVGAKRTDQNNSDEDEDIIVPDGSKQENHRNSKRSSFQANHNSMRRSQTMNNGFYQQKNQQPVDFNNNNNASSFNNNNNVPKSNSFHNFNPYNNNNNNNQVQNQFMPNVQNQFHGQQNRYNNNGAGMGMIPEQYRYQMPPQMMMMSNFGQNNGWNNQMSYQHGNNFNQAPNNQFNNNFNPHFSQNPMQNMNQPDTNARFYRNYAPPACNFQQMNNPQKQQSYFQHQNIKGKSTVHDLPTPNMMSQSSIVDKRFIQENNFIKKSF